MPRIKMMEVVSSCFRWAMMLAIESGSFGTWRYEAAAATDKTLLTK
jgi:hypothetical protein